MLRNRVWMRVAAGALAAGVGVLAACQIPVEPKPKGWWLSVKAASYCVLNATVTLSLPDGVSGELQFKDELGNHVGPPVHIDGGVTIEIPVPDGAVVADWRKNGEGGAKAGLAAAVPGAGAAWEAAAPSTAPSPHERHGLSEYGLGCATARYLPGQVGFAYALRAVSKDEGEALSMMQGVIDGDVGTAVPAPVTVDAFIEMRIEGNGITLVSSLPTRFADYTIVVSGQIVADLSSGLNAAVSPQANGWFTITSALPASVVPADGTMHLSQRAAGSEDSATLTLM